MSLERKRDDTAQFDECADLITVINTHLTLRQFRVRPPSADFRRTSRVIPGGDLASITTKTRHGGRPTMLRMMFVGLPTLIFIVGLPLALQWVPPNHLYGFRTAVTFSSRDTLE